MTQNISTHPPMELDTLETRFGLRVAAQLSTAAQALPHDITERLRFAREQALARQAVAADALQQAPSDDAWLGSAAATLALGRHPGGRKSHPWGRLGALLPLLALLLGLAAIDEWQTRQQIRDAAEIDSTLLADDLPPAAYSDPGFAAFLKATAGR